MQSPGAASKGVTGKSASPSATGLQKGIVGNNKSLSSASVGVSTKKPLQSSTKSNSILTGVKSKETGRTVGKSFSNKFRNSEII